MNEDVVMIEVTETGHFTNTLAIHTCWVTTEFVERFENAILAFKDGIEDPVATVNILTDVNDMALAYADSLGESWIITEHMFDYLGLSEDEIIDLCNSNDDLNRTISIDTKTIIRIGDVEVVV